MSPTQLSIRHLKGNGAAIIEVVEKWIPASPAGYKGRIIRKDLLGFDLFVVAPSKENPLPEMDVVLVQTTTRANMNARIRKLAEMNDTLDLLRMARIRLLVHGWRKKRVKRGGKAFRYELVEADIT